MRKAWAIVLLLAGAVSVAPAQTPTPAQRAQRQAATQKQLAALRGQIQSLSEEQRKLEGEKNAAARELREIDGRVSQSQRRLRETEARIAAQETELARLQGRQQELERGLATQRAELAQLLRSAYAMGRHEQLKLLLEQGRMSDLARALAYHRYFQQQRKEDIGRLTQELKTLADVSEQVRATTLELQAARAQQKGELDALAGQRRERGKLVSSLDAQYRDRESRIKALGRDEKATVALLERLRRLMEQSAKAPVRTPTTPGTRPATPNDARADRSVEPALERQCAGGFRGHDAGRPSQPGVVDRRQCGRRGAGGVGRSRGLRRLVEGLWSVVDPRSRQRLDDVVRVQRHAVEERRRQCACRRGDLDRRQFRRSGAAGAVFRTAPQRAAAGSAELAEEVVGELARCQRLSCK